MTAKSAPHYEAEVLAEHSRHAKTLDLRLNVTDRSFEDKVRTAFDLAKSAGQRLHVTFSLQRS